jgi:AcrR family transcriptional regulator
MERPVQARTPARERILDTAFRLFYLHGPRGVGIDTVIAESGVAKATLYKHFASKDDLIVAYLDRVDEDWTGKLKAAAATGTTARERLVSMFDALAAACAADGYHGCAFINTAAESAPGGKAHARAVEHKRQVRDWVEATARDARAANPARLARQLTALLDGALAEGVLDADPETPAAVREAARTLVETACPPDATASGDRPV